MVDDLEPGPDPRKLRDPSSRKPARPERADAALRSFNEDRAFSIRRPTQTKALAVKSEITGAVYWLNKWDTDPEGNNYDLRVRPYITEHFSIDDVEYEAKNLTPGDISAAENRGAAVEHYWKTNFWVHPPLPRGFRQMPADKLDAAHQASARTRNAQPSTVPPGTRRSVELRGD